MNPKKLIQSFSDRSLNLQEQLFRLIALIGISGLAVGLAVSVAAGEDKVNLVFLGAALLFIFCVVYFSVHYHKIQLGAVITAAIIIYIVLPVNFLTTGGIYGGAPVWFLFGTFYACLVVRGKIKYVFILSSFILSGICYYIAYLYPEMIVQHTLEMAYIDSFAAMFIATILICGMVLFQNKVYRLENETARKQKKEIEELNRMQNRFFSSMSHEIRTPINTIIGLNEMILREDISDEVAEDAKNIQGASKMLLSLINDILDLSKMESGKMDIVPAVYDVGAMLSDIVNMMWVRAREKGLEFHIDVDQTMPAQMYGDEVRIKQILINVLNNAVKYTSEGSVTLSIQCRLTERNRAQVSYSVTDTGMGIKKESIPSLFSTFKRADEKKNRYIEGTGLGLSIVKQLVELMEGDIAVNSIYTKGSTFVITLPQEIVGEGSIGRLDFEKKHTMNTREHYEQSFEAPEAQILIVDDNEMNLMVAEKLLRDTKVKTDTVTSGAECLKRTLQNRYDVILMDHLMPGMDGIECLHAVRTQEGGFNQDTPVVVLTANAGGENQSLYRREGFDGYLLKPVSGIQLETELLRLLPKELVKVMKASGSEEGAYGPVLTHKKRRLVMITTDSVCDLPKNLTETHQINVMPYRVNTEGGEFLDGIETETDGILAYIGIQGKHVKSEAPLAADYEEFFAEQLTKAQYIIHIAMAKNVSLGYANALEASRTFDNVLVVDSGHLSSGMGLMALRAAEYAQEGMAADSIVKELEHMAAKVRTSFIVDSTEYLARSGRISSGIDQLCRSLMLHPVIVLRNSSMKVKDIKVGTRDAVRRKYIAETLKNAGDIDRKILFITHAGIGRDELEEIKEQVEGRISFEEVIYQKASPAISTNCGPGSFGLLFMQKYEKSESNS